MRIIEELIEIWPNEVHNSFIFIVVIQLNKSKKKLKIKIENDLAVLPSHDSILSLSQLLLVLAIPFSGLLLNPYISVLY